MDYTEVLKSNLTTSGNSQNIISALKVCKSLNLPSIVFTGHHGGVRLRRWLSILFK
jgi:phosphoheptose isomerase